MTRYLLDTNAVGRSVPEIAADFDLELESIQELLRGLARRLDQPMSR